MLTRDAYIAILEKRAHSEFPVPHENDSHAAALQEVSSNMSDNRSTLKGLFDNAGAVQTQQGKELNKLFPGKTKKEAVGPLLKLAAAHAMTQLPFFKTASPYYIDVALSSFEREVEKIASAR